MDRRKLLTGGATLFAALGLSTAARADDTPVQDVDLDPSEIPAFAGGKLTGIVNETVEVEGRGTFSVEADMETGVFTVVNPDGSTTTQQGEDIVSRVASYLEMGPDAGPEEDAVASSPRVASVEGIQPMSLADDVCPYLVGAIGGGHTAAWRAALALVPVNPAVGVIIGLGYGAFWIWVGTNCPN